MEYTDLAQETYITLVTSLLLIKSKKISMRAKVTIRGIKRPATIEETTMNKAIQDIYEGMRAKMNKNFLEREALSAHQSQ